MSQPRTKTQRERIATRADDARVAATAFGESSLTMLWIWRLKRRARGALSYPAVVPLDAVVSILEQRSDALAYDDPELRAFALTGPPLPLP